MKDTSNIFEELRAACKEVLHRHGIQREHVCLHMLVSFVQVRNAAIRQDYEEMSPEYGEREAARMELARRYGLSERHVTNILYGAHDTM